MNVIRKVAVHILLVSVYGFTWLVAVLCGMIPRRPWKPTGRIMVTGTFFNPNWYLSHVTPLSRSGVKEVILVVDQPQLPLTRVTFVCPPRWASKLLSRAGAKAIWMIGAGLHYRPDLYMGYHIAPGACSALIAGKLLGRPACYQMTAGPVEIIGGGFEEIDGVGTFLGHPSKCIESMALAVVRLFDLVVVRGTRAKEYIEAKETKATVAIITGSVKGSVQSSQTDRGIHLTFVGQLIPRKQVKQFIRIVDNVKQVIPNVRAVVIGDGPLRTKLETYTRELKLTENIEFLGKRKDVEAFLARSKIFMLPSRSEGLSIAMVEAMAAGAVPVVANVGELSDRVSDGVNGYLIEPNNLDTYTERVLSLLLDHSMLNQFSRRAIEQAREHCDIGVITEKWKKSLRKAISEASGSIPEEILNHESTQVEV